ncbi:MAG: MBL fold metallo-hydrolase [Anaerolineae bacterium]|nr:MBL fold metallo-hydrolase [Anaerolineae bacterium]
MFVKQFLIGGDRNYAYLIADRTTKQAAAIDVSYSPQKVWDFAQANGYEIAYVFSTHGHGDHTNGNAEMRRLSGKQALLFGDVDPATGLRLADGVQLPLGELRIQIIHTPGHTQDAMCLYVQGPSASPGVVLTGDTLFVGKVGGTDFGAGARAEYDALHNKLLILPDDTRVLPGHNYGVAPESTIVHERETNPFLTQPDFDHFVWLKQNWVAYKAEHGIA